VVGMRDQALDCVRDRAVRHLPVNIRVQRCAGNPLACEALRLGHLHRRREVIVAVRYLNAVLRLGRILHALSLLAVRWCSGSTAPQVEGAAFLARSCRRRS
jgi:hypothetical protein